MALRCNSSMSVTASLFEDDMIGIICNCKSERLIVFCNTMRCVVFFGCVKQDDRRRFDERQRVLVMLMRWRVVLMIGTLLLREMTDWVGMNI